MDRLTECKKLVLNGARFVLGGKEHNNLCNRALDKDGKCIGYYMVLSDYDEVTDTFGGNYKQRIPANLVQEIGILDAGAKLVKGIRQIERHLWGCNLNECPPQLI